VGSDDIRIFVDSWAVAWTAVFLAGFVAELTPWPGLKALRGHAVARFMLLSSAAVVLGLTFLDAREASAVLAAWAIVISSVKLLYDWLVQLW
jgi:hypothetical protein